MYGPTEKIVTDSDWHGITGAFASFDQIAFDDSDWPVAVEQGP